MTQEINPAVLLAKKRVEKMKKEGILEDHMARMRAAKAAKAQKRHLTDEKTQK